MTRRLPRATPLRQQKRSRPQSSRLQVRSLSLTLRRCLTVRNPVRTSNASSRCAPASSFFFCAFFCDCAGFHFPHGVALSLFLSSFPYKKIMTGAVWWPDKPKDSFRSCFLKNLTCNATASFNRSGPTSCFETLHGCLPAPPLMD